MIKAFLIKDAAEFEAGVGPSLTILVSSIMWSTDKVLCSMMYPRIENIPSAGASDHVLMPC